EFLESTDRPPTCCNTSASGSEPVAPPARRLIMRPRIGILFLGLCLVVNNTVLAQMSTDGQSQAELLKLMGELPPETMKNVDALGKILDRDLKEGKLTQARIQEELKSGTFEQTLRNLNPEAGPLLDSLGQQMKRHPNAENLPNLLNGMAGADK